MKLEQVYCAQTGARDRPRLLAGSRAVKVPCSRWLLTRLLLERHVSLDFSASALTEALDADAAKAAVAATARAR